MGESYFKPGQKVRVVNNTFGRFNQIGVVKRAEEFVPGFLAIHVRFKDKAVLSLRADEIELVTD